MATVTSKCPHCGAQIVFEEKTNVTICRYCDSIIAIQNINATLSNGISEDNYKLRNIVPELTYLSNYFVSNNNAQGGILWINSEEIVFKPHKFNFGSLEKSYCKIADICGYEKNALTTMTIYTRDGSEIKEHVYNVWNKNDIINNIEYYRRKYFADKGLEVPQLTKGSIKPIANAIEYPSPTMAKITDYASKNMTIFLMIVSAIVIAIVLLITLLAV